VAVTEPTAEEDGQRVYAPVSDRIAALTEVVRGLQEEEIAVEDVSLRRPTLDDVFLRLTGHHTEDKGADAA